MTTKSTSRQSQAPGCSHGYTVYAGKHRPTIHTSADLDLWLDGWDAGSAATLRSLAAVPADMLPAVVAKWAADLTDAAAVAGAAPTQTTEGTAA